MTPQEAIQRVHQHNECHSKRERFAVYITEALNMAVESLEKQIPKKVNNLEVFSDIGACIPKTKSGNCPICNDFMVGEQAYCSFCGQALDWSDTE